MIYHINTYLLVTITHTHTHKWKSYFTYRLWHLLNILSIFNELEERLWPRAVSVSFGGIFAYSGAFAETAEVERVDDSALVALTAH